MAYRRGAQRDVSQFVQGGFRQDDGLYEDRERAGSARDRLRDLNRIGFRDGSDGPQPYFSNGNAARKHGRKRKASFLERLRREIKADKTAAGICCFLMAVVIALGFAFVGQLRQKHINLSEIADYNRRTAALVEANETLNGELTRLTSEERIHNLAQNTYGMLRRERAETSEIYIQMPEKYTSKDASAAQEPKMEVLDILLGLMDRLHIGS